MKEKHEINTWPEIDADGYNELKKSISNGYDKSQPIILFEDKIIDGWNRYRACMELGVEPVYKQFDGSDLDALDKVWQSNVRRDVPKDVRAAQYLLYNKERAKRVEEEVERERRRKQAETQSELKEAIRQKVAEQPRDHKAEEERTSAVKQAKEAGVNKQYIKEVKKLEKEAPEKFQELASGKTSLSEIKKEERKKKIEETRKKIEQEELVKPSGKFSVIAIDPPWAYEERGGVKNDDYDPDKNRSAVPYPTMTVNEISKIELPAKDDCVLFLWTTHAFLRDAFTLLDDWGFTYKATMVWDKEIMGMGRNIRMQVEFCLLAAKGNPVLTGGSVRDIMREKRRQHSRKPECFYAMVEELTVGNRLDYFAREAREGWSIYGAETNKF